jgi:hypothetical protein
MSIEIEVVESGRPDDEDAYFRCYTYGVPEAKEAVYPRAHVVAAAFHDPSACMLDRMPPETRQGCLEMLGAGWIPDCLGKGGTPRIGIVRDQKRAAAMKTLLEEAIRNEKTPSTST